MSIYKRARQRTRSHIMQATLDCLLYIGYKKLTVTEIANTADIGRGTFYVYFNSIDDVLLALIHQYFEELQATIHEMMSQYESPEKEIRAWKAAYDSMVDLKPIINMLNDPSAAQLSNQVRVVIIAGFEASLKTEAFLYPTWMQLPTDVMATFSASAVLALMQRWLAGELVYSADEMAEMTYKLLYHKNNQL